MAMSWTVRLGVGLPDTLRGGMTDGGEMNRVGSGSADQRAIDVGTCRDGMGFGLCHI
jgi:hypothetical protein